MEDEPGAAAEDAEFAEAGVVFLFRGVFLRAGVVVAAAAAAAAASLRVVMMVLCIMSCSVGLKVERATDRHHVLLFPRLITGCGPPQGQHHIYGPLV